MKKCKQRIQYPVLVGTIFGKYLHIIIDLVRRSSKVFGYFFLDSCKNKSHKTFYSTQYYYS